MTPNTLPHARQNEEALIGAVLQDPKWFYLARTRVGAEDFYDPKHATIWSHFEMLFEAQTPIDIVTVRRALELSKKMPSIGGPGYLSALRSSVPNPDNAEGYARDIRDAADGRMVIRESNAMITLAESGAPKEKIVERAQAIIAGSHVGEKTYTAKEITAASWAMVEQYQSTEGLLGMTTGVDPLDHATLGLMRKNMTLLAGLPGHGKSSFAYYIARANMKLGRRVHLVSPEMTKEQVCLRIACDIAGLDSEDARRYQGLSDVDLAKLAKAYAEIDEYALTVAEDSEPTTNMILAEIYKRQPDLVIIDHLELLHDSQHPYESDEKYLLRLSRRGKVLAREGNCHVIVVVHIKKTVQDRKDKIPTAADMRYISVRDSDLAFIFTIPWLLDKVMYEQHVARIDLVKNRDGKADYPPIEVGWAYGRIHRRSALDSLRDEI